VAGAPAVAVGGAGGQPQELQRLGEAARGPQDSEEQHMQQGVGVGATAAGGQGSEGRLAQQGLIESGTGEGQEVGDRGTWQGSGLTEEVKREVKEQLQGRQLFAWL
jgi:hypothetical protein